MMFNQDFFDQHYEVLKNLFMRYGIKSVSMDDVASTLHISKRTLYENFDSKDNLLSLILDRFIQEDTAEQKLIAQNPDAMDGLHSFLSHAVEILGSLSESTIYDLKKSYTRLYRELDNFRSQTIRENISFYLSKGQQQGYFIDDISIDLQSELFLLVMTSILESDIKSDMDRRIELFKTFYFTQLKGIATEKGLQKLNSYEF